MSNTLSVRRGETFLVENDFSAELATGETLSSCEATATLRGVEADSFFDGSASILDSAVRARVDSEAMSGIYEATISATTSLGNTLKAVIIVTVI